MAGRALSATVGVKWSWAFAAALSLGAGQVMAQDAQEAQDEDSATTKLDVAPEADSRLAQSEPTHRKKKKKKRKKKTGDDPEATPGEGEKAGEPAASGGGSNPHKAQEGVEEPYSWEVGLLSDFVVNSTKTGEAKGGSADYNLEAKGLYIIAKSLELGGSFDYAEQSTKTKDSKSDDTRYILSLIGVYNFGNLDHDVFVFFVDANFGFGASSGKAGEVKTSSSITQYGLGFGAHYFVDSNVALTGEFKYDAGSEKVKDAPDPTSFTQMHLMRIGFSLFL